MNSLYYAHYEQSTKLILGWYSDDIHGIPTEDGYDLSNVPTPYMEVFLEDWRFAVDNEHNKVDLKNNSTLVYDFKSPEQKAEEAKRVARINSKGLVREATVNHSGYIYQTDEDSLNSMATVIMSLDEGEYTIWRMKDNSEIAVTREDLRAALKLGVSERSRIMEEV